jgi:hypothetical protein
VFLTRSHVLQRHTLRIISVIPLVFQDRMRGANPRITGHILPLKQPQLQLFHDDLVIIFPRQIVQFLRVVFQIVQLPFRPVVILLQSFEPVQIFFVSGAVQNALKTHNSDAFNQSLDLLETWGTSRSLGRWERRSGSSNCGSVCSGAF